MNGNRVYGKTAGIGKEMHLTLRADVDLRGFKAELKIHFSPKKSYTELMEEYRGLKVYNLRELLIF